MSGTRIAFRPLHGILLLDKPAGISSNQAIQQVRRLFRADKAGHTGSLDPLATGLLPVCFGEATKIAGLLLGEAKGYEAVARLGATTDTDDADGSVLIERPVPVIDEAALDAALAPLRGRIRQRAPIYAALKQGGEPLYAKARRGESVEAPVRDVEVSRLECLDRGDGWLRLCVECGSGTYVRSLVRDLGEALGCGAHVTSLRRLWVEPFRDPTMFTLPALQALALNDPDGLEGCLLPIEDGLAGRAAVRLDADQQRRLGQGQPVAMTSTGPIEGPVAVFSDTGRALGLGSLDGNVLKAQRLFTWAVAQPPASSEA